MQLFIQRKNFCTLSLGQLRYRNTSPAGNNFGNFFFCHTFVYQSHLSAVYFFFFDFQLSLQFWKLSILQFCCTIQIILPFCKFDLFIHIFNLFTKPGQIFHRFFLIVPLCFLPAEFLVQFRKFTLQHFQTILTRSVCFFLQCSFFNLHLHDTSLQFIQFRRQRIQLCLNQCTRFIHQVNRLIRKESIRNVTMRKCGSCYKCTVCDFYPMKNFIAFFQSAENGNRVFHGRFIYQYRLKTSFQCRIFFNIFTILIQRCCTDTVQFSTRKHRFQHISGIHSAVCLASSHDQMKLINKENDFSFTFTNFFQHCFQTFFKLTAILRTCYQRSHIQRKNFLIL